MDVNPEFEDVAAELAPRGVVVGNVFGSRALKSGSKAFACLLKGGTVAFRLGAGTPDHTAALALEGAHLFDPSERDQPFKDWVEVPPAHEESWMRFAVAALDHLDA
ncbi:hypothetical protein [Catenulispora rubra]|uniref:hypothetical protein n=1 Tax=Catenulispora rubra TaxID=280293 RepID=UPI0018923B4D|nr:hypothetical protein [Catenulispora rubra]